MFSLLKLHALPEPVLCNAEPVLNPVRKADPIVENLVLRHRFANQCLSAVEAVAHMVGSAQNVLLAAVYRRSLKSSSTPN